MWPFPLINNERTEESLNLLNPELTEGFSAFGLDDAVYSKPVINTDLEEEGLF